LGEISALVAVGSIRFATAVTLARLRGQAMQEAVPEGGAMAAIIGLPLEEVEKLCEQSTTETESVSPANLNGGNQIVVAGHAQAVERICDLAHELDARSVYLKVSAPFHCALMKPAAERLSAWLENVDIAPMRATVISCVNAEPIATTDLVRGLLVAQVTNRVRWEDSMRKAVHMGCEQAVELGNGNVLRGLMRRIDKRIKVYNLGEPEDVPKLPLSSQPACAQPA
jgi:[acyl-carrier-protein] S-malonyltransferase